MRRRQGVGGWAGGEARFNFFFSKGVGRAGRGRKEFFFLSYDGCLHPALDLSSLGQLISLFFFPLNSRTLQKKMPQLPISSSSSEKKSPKPPPPPKKMISTSYTSSFRRLLGLSLLVLALVAAAASTASAARELRAPLFDDGPPPLSAKDDILPIRYAAVFNARGGGGASAAPETAVSTATAPAATSATASPLSSSPSSTNGRSLKLLGLLAGAAIGKHVEAVKLGAEPCVFPGTPLCDLAKGEGPLGAVANVFGGGGGGPPPPTPAAASSSSSSSSSTVIVNNQPPAPLPPQQQGPISPYAGEAEVHSQSASSSSDNGNGNSVPILAAVNEDVGRGKHGKHGGGKRHFKHLGDDAPGPVFVGGGGGGGSLLPPVPPPSSASASSSSSSNSNGASSATTNTAVQGSGKADAGASGSSSG